MYQLISIFIGLNIVLTCIAVSQSRLSATLSDWRTLWHTQPAWLSEPKAAALNAVLWVTTWLGWLALTVLGISWFGWLVGLLAPFASAFAAGLILSVVFRGRNVMPPLLLGCSLTLILVIYAVTWT